MARKISVLVVEDDQFIVSAFKYKFEEEGFSVEIAYNGQEALDALKKNIPDIIILDLIMPVKDGFEVIAELKKNKKLSKIPIIIASNLGQEQHMLKAMDMGANDYIIKSELSLDKLVEKIKSMI